MGFWICLNSDTASHLLIACSPCFGPEMCAEVFWKKDCLLQVGPCACYTVWKGAHLDVILKFKTGGWGEERDLCLSPSSVPPSFLTSIYTLDFQLFQFWVFLLFCFFFSLLLFQFRNSFFPKHVLPFTSPNKTNCCAMIYAETHKFLLLYSIIPCSLSPQKAEKKPVN